MTPTPATPGATAAPNPSGGHTRSEMDRWIRDRAASFDLEPIAEITEVKRTPWSTVLTVTGPRHRLYFKAAWPAQRYEASATALVALHAPDAVPRLVAVDPGRGWMLLADAGQPIDRLETAHQLPLLAEAVHRYAELQLACMPYVSSFLSAGVPDRRDLRPHLDRLIAAYPSHREDSLTDAELAGLRDLSGEVASMERHLAALVPASIEHGDLHAGNIAVDVQAQARLFDWADVSIACPFLSLAKLLGSLEESLELLPGDPAFDVIVTAYLAPFRTLKGEYDRATLVRGARVLGSISRAITWDYIVAYFPAAVRAGLPDPVAATLRDCLRLATQ